MATQWAYRQAHGRRLKSGRLVCVGGSWALCAKAGSKPRQRCGRKCPVCGAKVLSVPMPNGGWVHFESRVGLRRVKHPCLHIGEGMSDTRDPLTLDLFADRSSDGAPFAVTVAL